MGNSDSSVNPTSDSSEADSAHREPTLGEILRQGRESRGVSLEQVSQRTRIPERILSLLESGRTQDLPNPTFVRGFLRSVARELGMDPQDLLNRFEREAARAGTSKQMVVRSLAPKGTVGSEHTPVGVVERKPWPAKIWVLIGLLVVLVLVAGTVWTRQQMGLNSPTPEASAPPAQVAEAVPAKEAEAPPPAPEESKAPVVPEQILVLRAKTDSWLRIGLDGKAPKEIILRRDQRATYKAEKSFELFLGNAGGVEITFNGKSIPAPGPEGTVRRLTLPAPESN